MSKNTRLEIELELAGLTGHAESVDIVREVKKIIVLI